MCLLTYLPELVQPDVEALRRGAKVNSDGHGFAIVIPHYGKAGRILVRKSMTVEGLLKEFSTLRLLYPDGPAIFHSRITTDGVTDLFNCHPFMLSGDKRTVIGHNGILPSSVRPEAKDPRSDTRIFAEEVGGIFQLHTVVGRELAGEWMGSYNKMAILTVDPAFDQYGYIINESQGEWHQGAWYSNGSFRGYRTVTSYTGTGWYAGSEYRVWEQCENPACTAKSQTVSPYTLRCTMCKACALCVAHPCECVLVEGETRGKGQPVPSRTAAASGENDTVVVGAVPKSGATDATNWHEDFATSVDEYYEALEVANRASRGIHSSDYDYDADTDPADMGVSQLEQVLALVDHLNGGGELEDMEPEAQQVVIEAALDTLAEHGLIKQGDPGDDQDAAMLAGVGTELGTRGLLDAGAR